MHRRGRNALRPGCGAGLGSLFLVRRLRRRTLGRRRAFRKRRRGTGAQSRGDRTNLPGIDGLYLYASRRRVLNGGLGAQRL